MLNFITDKDLRENIERSIQYLFILTKDLDKHDAHIILKNQIGL